ncbi:hypothetical protein H4R24_004969 [Coemansia sp. RSA 988]|nr:hypothetical protein H4R24_004969 [Coemansia sp. RSA 988]
MSGVQIPNNGLSIPDDNSPKPIRKRGRPRKPESEKKNKRKKRVVDPNRPKPLTGLAKPMKLSENLRDFLEQKYCARTDVVKELWKYIKAQGLQDPADGRYILCDKKLNLLFKTDRMSMYEMNKLLNVHLIKPTPEENLEAIKLLNLPPNHPAHADSAGLFSSTSNLTTSQSPVTVAGVVDQKSPIASDTGVSSVVYLPQTVVKADDTTSYKDTPSTLVQPTQQPVTPNPILPPQSSSINDSTNS